MHVLVTGAAGFIGSHVCERLVARGHSVTGLDAFDGYVYSADAKRDTAKQLETLERFRLVAGDICDAPLVNELLDDGVDVVCHLAALAGVRPSIAEPLRYWRANVEGTGVLIESMRARGLQRLVFASSSSVYGVRAATGTQMTAFREDDPCIAPASPYAASKRMNELQLSTYTELFGTGVFALRYFTVYGPRQRPDMAIRKFTAAIAAGRPVTLFGDGSSRRDYTYIDDIVDGTVAAIERVSAGRFEILNLGGTVTTSLAQLIELIERTVGRSATIERKPDQAGDVPLTFANVDRARAELGYQPKVALEEGIARFWDWYRPRG